MLHRTWDTGEESFYLEKAVNIIGAEKWPSLQQFDAEEPHAMFEYDEDQKCFWVRDISVDAGMTVNGIPLSKNHSVRLKNGDKVSFGFSPEFTFTAVPNKQQPRTVARPLRYPNDIGVQMLPKLNRAKLESPRIATVIDSRAPEERRAASPMTNAYRRRVYRAGSFEGPRETVAKHFSNNWVNGEGGRYAPSDSGSWDGMIEKRSPRSRYGFVNTQHAHTIRDMQMKISNLESLLHQHEQTSNIKSNIADADNTVEMAQQILELRSQLNRKEEEVRNMREQAESAHESSKMKEEITKLKHALAKKDHRHRHDTDSDHSLINSYDTEDRLKFRHRKRHGSDDDDALFFDTHRRSLDSVSTLGGGGLNDSVGSLGLFGDVEEKRGKKKHSHFDHKIQMKLYESKIEQLENKLKIFEEMELNKDDSLAVEDVMKDKLQLEKRLNLTSSFLDTILKKLEGNIRSSSEETLNFAELIDEVKNEWNSKLTDEPEPKINDEAWSAFHRMASTFQYGIDQVFSALSDMAQGSKDLKANQKTFETRIALLGQILHVFCEDAKQNIEMLKNNPQNVSDNVLMDLPDKMNQIDDQLENWIRENQMEKENVGEHIDWVHQQLMEGYRTAREICPLILDAFVEEEEDKKRQAAFEEFGRQLLKRLSDKKEILDFKEIINDELNKNLASVDDHWLKSGLENLVDLLSHELKPVGRQNVFEMGINTDETSEDIASFEKKLAFVRQQEVVSEMSKKTLENEVEKLKESYRKLSNEYQTLLNENENVNTSQQEAQKRIQELQSEIDQIREESTRNEEVQKQFDENSKSERVADAKKNNEESDEKLTELLKERISKLEAENETLRNSEKTLTNDANVLSIAEDPELSNLRQQLNKLETSPESNYELKRDKTESDEQRRRIEYLENELKVKDAKILQMETTSLNSSNNNSWRNVDFAKSVAPKGNGFFDGPFQDAADHMNLSHSSLSNSIHSNNAEPVQRQEDAEVLWNLSQRLASFMDEKQQPSKQLSEYISTSSSGDRLNTAKEIADRVEGLLQKIRLQNEELKTARSSRSKKEELENYVENGERDSKDEPVIYNQKVKKEKQKKKEMPVKVVTFNLPDH